MNPGNGIETIPKPDRNFEYRCEVCTWAYPEKFHDALVIRLERTEAQKLVMIAEEEGKDPRVFAQEL